MLFSVHPNENLRKNAGKMTNKETSEIKVSYEHWLLSPLLIYSGHKHLYIDSKAAVKWPLKIFNSEKNDFDFTVAMLNFLELVSK